MASVAAAAALPIFRRADLLFLDTEIISGATWATGQDQRAFELECGSRFARSKAISL